MKPNYGIDAPGVVVTFGVIAVAGLATAIAGWTLAGGGVALAMLSIGLTALAWCGISALVMIFGSKVVKLRMRETLLDSLDLEGAERVLDIGCGRGLLLVAAARRLPRGRAVGIDLWQTRDQSGNDPDRTRANARAEGVEDRIEIHTGDMRELPFPDGSFDAVVSSWAIHNVPQAEGREKAVREAARVLRPGGRFLCVDLLHARDYAVSLRALGWTDVTVSGPSFLFLIPSRVVRAVKPTA